jgi:hypothetical protein
MSRKRQRKEIHIKPQAALEQRDFLLVCSRTSIFADDCSDFCANCGCTIYFRPHAPIPKEGGRYCLQCALPIMKQPDTELWASETSQNELRLLLADTPPHKH